jgi:hypothetical protein
MPTRFVQRCAAGHNQGVIFGTNEWIDRCERTSLKAS